MRPESGFHIAPNWPQIGKLTMMSQFGDMTSSPNFFDVAVFLLSSWVTGPNFMSISLLVLELWQFFFISDSRNLEIGSTPIWEIWKSEVPPYEFCPISGNMVELEIPKFLIQLFNQKYLNETDSMIRWKWPDGITKFLFNRQSICRIWNYMLKFYFPLVYFLLPTRCTWDVYSW